MKEIWKDIPGYEGYYQVSNLGMVKSLERIDKTNHPVKEKILKLRLANNGYLRCNLSKSGVSKTHSVHILVSICFLNHKPNGHTLLIDHKDNIRTNNVYTNLKIVTSRINTSKDRKGGSSKYIGVTYHKATNKWQANICVDRHQKYLGVYETEIDASKAYQKELKKIQYEQQK